MQTQTLSQNGIFALVVLAPRARATERLERVRKDVLRALPSDTHELLRPPATPDHITLLAGCSSDAKLCREKLRAATPKRNLNIRTANVTAVGPNKAGTAFVVLNVTSRPLQILFRRLRFDPCVNTTASHKLFPGVGGRKLGFSPHITLWELHDATTEQVAAINEALVARIHPADMRGHAVAMKRPTWSLT